jgi:hypothetical protein
MTNQQSMLIAAGMIALAVLFTNGTPSLLNRLLGGEWQVTIPEGNLGVVWAWRFNTVTGKLQRCSGAFSTADHPGVEPAQARCETLPTPSSDRP